MTHSPPPLTLKNVSRNFGAFSAVSNVSEEFGPDDLHCIIGPNGAGKSTLLNMICGTLSVSEGEILYGQQAIHGLSGDKIARLGIARKFQVPTVFPSLTVQENLEVSGPARMDWDLYERVLTTINLQDDQQKKGSDLSHGKKQWLEIGMALMMQPKVLLLDEPTAGLSAHETRATAHFLRGLRGQVTVVVIEHDMAFVREIDARTIVLHCGEVIASGPFTHIEQSDVVRDVYLGRR